jgi:hypothetical protein
MKSLKSILFIWLLVFVKLSLSQNGVMNSKYMVLPFDRTHVGIYNYSNDSLVNVQNYIINHMLYAYDGDNKLAVLNEIDSLVILYNIDNNTYEFIDIPMQIKAMSLFLTNNSIFIGGWMNISNQILQYNIENNEWYSLEIPDELLGKRKAIDFFVASNDTLIAVDDLLMPNYVIYYQYNDTTEAELMESFLLAINGTYEHIYQAKLSKSNLFVLSRTVGGYQGYLAHLTNYRINDLFCNYTVTFSDHQTSFSHWDFAIIQNKVIIGSQNDRDQFTYFVFDTRQNYSSKLSIDDINIIKTKNINGRLIKITAVPNENKAVITFEDETGQFVHSVVTVD